LPLQAEGESTRHEDSCPDFSGTMSYILRISRPSASLVPLFQKRLTAAATVSPRTYMFCFRCFSRSTAAREDSQVATTTTTDSTVASRNMTVVEEHHVPVTKASGSTSEQHSAPVTKQPGANIPAVKRCPEKFTGQVVMVTGAASGIGKVTAEMFATQGASLVLVDIDNDKLRLFGEELEKRGTNVICGICNLSIETEVDAMVSGVVRHVGKIDVMVHLAGIYPFKSIVDHSAVDYGRVMSVNMDSCFYLTRAVLPRMRVAGYGRIINTASGVVLHPEPGLGVYAAAKSAVAGFTRSTAVEAGPGITANAVSPGLIFNESTWANPGSRAVFEKALARQCVKRFGLPTDVAEMICFLASPESEFITGQLFDVSGGSTFLH
jgi:NAD(P)-dependent dehydrogenase (short-subunit alcohol dehydrogenase family)